MNAKWPRMGAALDLDLEYDCIWVWEVYINVDAKIVS